jgi:hypothetical protein
MATQIKPTKKDSPKIHHGANRGSNSGGSVDLGYKDGTNPGFGKNKSRVDEVDASIGHLSKSAGNEPIKTDGITMRGHGAAIKGIKSRGPMA